MSGRRYGALLLAAMCVSATAGAAIPGDLNLDCKVDTADTFVLSRAVMGAITLDSEQQDAADVAPIVSGVSSPDGSITVADLVVLLRAVAGLQALPGGVNVPTLSSPSGDVTVNPLTVTGAACPSDVVMLYVNGLVRGTVTAGADGSFVFTLVGIGYDTNTLETKSTAFGETSAYSNQLTVNNTSASIATTNPPLASGAVTVWPPPRGGGNYELTTTNFIIPSGKTLILPPGTTVRFQTGGGSAGGGLEVAGRLLVQGAPGGGVTLQQLGASGNRWEGILVTAGVDSLIEYALITGATNALKVTGAATSATLRESELADFFSGITATTGASVTVADSSLHSSSGQNIGITINAADLSITGSTLFNLTTAIDVLGGSFVSIGPDNEFHGFRDAAIWISGPADGIINGNVITRSPPTTVAARWGIRLRNSSPEIRGNVIHDVDTGIRIAGSSNPLITDGNAIYDNIWGIWIEGSEDVDEDTVGNPNPIITGNTIRDNAGEVTIAANTDYCSKFGANLCFSAYPPGSNAFIDARSNYWGTSNPNAIRNMIIDPDLSVFQFNSVDYANSPLSEPVAIDLSNYRESESGVPGSTPLFYNTVTGVSHSPQLMAPTLGDALSIQFTLVTPTDVALSIYEEDAPANVKRTLLAPALGAGPHTIVWDGKDDSGNFVSDEAYAYAITTTVAGITDVFNPPRAPEGDKDIHLALASTAFPGSYNIYRNEPLKILFDVENVHGRVRVNRVLQGTPAATVTLADFVPFPEMFRQLFVYDGFDPNGVFLGSATRRYYFHPDPIQRNAVIVERTTPRIAGPTYAPVRYPPPKVTGQVSPPAIEVKGDPYLVRLSYDQLSRIRFCIDQAAYLTVKILKPERGNPDVAADVVATLLQDTTTPHTALNCAGGASPYVVEWDGTEPDAADPYVLRPVADGAYTFTIEARNALQTNLRSIYRGIVQTRQ